MNFMGAYWFIYLFLIQAKMIVIMISVEIFRALISQGQCSGKTQITS